MDIAREMGAVELGIRERRGLRRAAEAVHAPWGRPRPRHLALALVAVLAGACGDSSGDAARPGGDAAFDASRGNMAEAAVTTFVDATVPDASTGEEAAAPPDPDDASFDEAAVPGFPLESSTTTAFDGGRDGNRGEIDASTETDAGAPTGPGRWQMSVALSVARQELGVAAIGDNVYAVGGHSALVDAFDTKAGVWHSVAALPAALDHPNVAAVAGKLYVVGATEAEKTIPGDVNAFLVYEPQLNRWSQIRPMPAGSERGASGVAVIDRKIYVAGGWKNYGTATSNFSAYDTVSDTWETLPDLVPKRDHLIAGAVRGIVYAVGGRNGTISTPMGRVDAFDPATRTWTARAAMVTPRGGMAAVTLFDLIYVFGGEGNTAALSMGVFAQAEAYDPGTNTWRELAPMRIPKHGIGAAAVNGKVYVPAGAVKQGGGAQVSSMDIFVP